MLQEGHWAPDSVVVLFKVLAVSTNSVDLRAEQRDEWAAILRDLQSELLTEKSNDIQSRDRQRAYLICVVAD